MSDRERTLQRLNKDGDSRHMLLEGGGGGEVTIDLKARFILLVRFMGDAPGRCRIGGPGPWPGPGGATSSGSAGRRLASRVVPARPEGRRVRRCPSPTRPRACPPRAG